MQQRIRHVVDGVFFFAALKWRTPSACRIDFSRCRGAPGVETSLDAARK
jgi:hypothetical protein